MKGIGKIILCILCIIAIVFMVWIDIYMFNVHQEKIIYTNNESRVILNKNSTGIVSDEEAKFLDENLKSNENVLMVFEQDLTNDVKIEDIISKYTNKIVPYVIFKYDTQNRTLSTISSTDVQFENVYIEDVDYTYVYKLIPLVHSNVMVTVASNYMEATIPIFLFEVILLITVIGCFIYTIAFIKTLKYRICYKDEKKLFKYRVSFFGKSIIIKFVKDSDVYEIYTNGKLKKKCIKIPNINDFLDFRTWLKIKLLNSDIHYCVAQGEFDDNSVEFINPGNWQEQFEEYNYKHVFKRNRDDEV